MKLAVGIAGSLGQVHRPKVLSRPCNVMYPDNNACALSAWLTQVYIPSDVWFDSKHCECSQLESCCPNSPIKPPEHYLDTMSPKTVLITGSSSGFGLSLVQLFLRQGHNVIATSRSPQKTPDLVSSVDNHSGKRGKWLQLDVTWPQAKIKSTVSEAAKIFGPIDVLINNAGYSHCGPVEDIDEEKARVQFDTNYWGVLRMSKAVLPSMRERKQGTIVNVSSIAGLTALPIMPVYAGSKWALEGESHSLPWTCRG